MASFQFNFMEGLEVKSIIRTVVFVYYLLALSPSSYSRFAIDKAWNSPNELLVTNDMVIVYGLFTCFLPSLLRKLTDFLCFFVKVLQSSVSSSTASRTQPTILSMEVLSLSWGKSRCVQQLLDLWTYIYIANVLKGPFTVLLDKRRSQFISPICIACGWNSANQISVWLHIRRGLVDRTAKFWMASQQQKDKTL